MPVLQVKSDIEIARQAVLKPIGEIGEKLDIPANSLIPFGRSKAKIDLQFIDSLSTRQGGKLILVTAITPTSAGEGKTTTTVGLGDGLEPNRQKRNDLPAGAQSWTMLRHERRRSGRRVCTSSSYGRYQPPLHW